MLESYKLFNYLNPSLSNPVIQPLHPNKEKGSRSTLANKQRKGSPFHPFPLQPFPIPNPSTPKKFLCLRYAYCQMNHKRVYIQFLTSKLHYLLDIQSTT